MNLQLRSPHGSVQPLHHHRSPPVAAAATPAPVFDAGTTAVDDIAGDYILDPAHTRIGFSARHAMVTTVRGQFDEFEGTAHVDTANPAASTVEVTIQRRERHHRPGPPRRPPALRRLLRRRELPRDQLRLHRRRRATATDWTITGDLTIKGVTKPVTVDFESTGSAKDPFGNLRVGFEGSATINRKDWGLTWNAALETGGVLVSEKIKLEFDVSAIAVPAAS